MVNGIPTILDAFGNTSCLQMHLEVHSRGDVSAAIRFALHLLEIHPGMQEVSDNAKNGAPTCYISIGYTYIRVYLFHWWN